MEVQEEATCRLGWWVASHWRGRDISFCLCSTTSWNSPMGSCIWFTLQKLSHVWTAERRELTGNGGAHAPEILATSSLESSFLISQIISGWLHIVVCHVIPLSRGLAFGIFSLRTALCCFSSEVPFASLNSRAAFAGEQGKPAGVLLATASPIRGWRAEGLERCLCPSAHQWVRHWVSAEIRRVYLLWSLTWHNLKGTLGFLRTRQNK